MAETSRAAYLAARKNGRKFVSDNANRDAHGYLPILDERIKGVEIVGEINLGLHEIPLKKVIGTRTATRSSAFAGNFMPLMDEDSEFAIKWMKLYDHHIQDGINDPIKVYEYINRYYVQEGNKRVSVLNHLGAASIPAVITRVIPKRDESNRSVSIYYEFLDFDRRKVFDNLWFSRRGSFTRLVEIIERFRSHNPDLELETAELINSIHKSFRVAYKRAGPHGLDFTTGDALLEYIRLFGVPYDMNAEEIAKNVHTAYLQFVQASGGGTQHTVEEKESVQSPGWRMFVKKPRSVKVAFAFEGNPVNLPWTRQHDFARRRLEYKYGDKVEIITRFNIHPRGESCYQALCELVEQRPDVIFTTSPEMADITTRVALENPDMIIFNCNRSHERWNLNTYFPKTQEATFLCGVIAGSMSRRDKLGYMTSNKMRQTYCVNAFALGARMVNPRVQVMNFLLTESDNYEEHNHACSEFSKFGADVALVQQSYTNPLSRKAFPGIISQLNMIHPKLGFPDECIGAVVCDWFTFYDHIVGGILAGESLHLSGGEECIHFGWGVDTGMVDMLGVDAFMGQNALNLLRVFRMVVETGQLHPFTGPVFDNKGVMRIEPYDTPTLAEIQNMDWYASPIVKVT